MENNVKGFIKKKVWEKGFGFISSEVRDKDIFFHANDMGKTSFDELEVGMEVSFNLSEGTENREKAIDVNLI